MKKQATAKGKTNNKKETTKNQKPMTTKTQNKAENKGALAPVQQKNYIMVAPTDLVVNEKTNYRNLYEEIEELSESISENGLRNPLKAYMKDGKMILREGFRRMRAINLAISKGKKIERVPVIIDERPLSEEERTLEFLINNEGKPYSMLEQSDVIKDLLKFGLKVTEIVKRTAKARGYIENLIALTQIPTKVRDYIILNKISAHAVIQILAAIKGDETKLLEEVEAAIQSAKEAGKSKATPKHVKTGKVKSKSFGKFYKWLEEIVDTIAGRKETIKDKEKVVSDMLVYFENGQKAKEVAERYFIDKAKTSAKAESVKVAAKKVPAKKAAQKPAKTKK
jgi:ParB/RepB/Spo0J family partition protein